MPDPIFIDPQTEESIPPQPAPVAPSLTPMQQRFISQLAAQPQATSVYQPEQSFNDPAYQQKLYEWEQEVRRTAEAARAEQAIQSGIRYIYQRRYDEDLKKGVPEPTAFSRMMLGIAMHGPKTDPIKAFEAFRARPAPQPTNMAFGEQKVPGVIETGRFGQQSFKPIPQNAFPAPPLGETGTPLRDPITGKVLGTRFPTGPRSGQIIGKTEEVKEQPFKLAEFRKLLDREEEVEKDIKTYESFKDLEEEDKQLLKLRKAQLEDIQRQKTALKSGASTETPKTESKRIRVISPNGKTGTVSEANLEEALKAGYKRQ